MLRRALFVLTCAAAMPAVAMADKPAVPPAAATPTPVPAKAAGPGTAVVKQANETIAGLLKQKAAPGSAEEKALAAKVTTSVRDFLDIDQLGKAAMVDQWAKLSKAQQDEFLKVLRALIEANYVKGLRQNLAYTVDYTGESTDKDGHVVVTTKINAKRNGRPVAISVDYVLAKEGGKLRAFDVATEGAGLVEGYRAGWNKIIAKDGFDGLIKRMKDKQAELEKPAAPAP